MLQKLTYVDNPEVVLQGYGGYNDAPPNLREIKAKEFAQSMFFIYSPEYVEYRQVDPKQVGPREKYFLDLRLFYMHDGTGFALAHDYWKGRVRYFRFGKCMHEATEELSPQEARANGVEHWGMCYHVYKCRNCGYTYAVDSSD